MNYHILFDPFLIKYLTFIVSFYQLSLQTHDKRCSNSPKVPKLAALNIGVVMTGWRLHEQNANLSHLSQSKDISSSDQQSIDILFLVFTLREQDIYRYLLITQIIYKEMSKEQCETVKCKVLLLGQSAVGKTSLFKQFMQESIARITPTIGVQFKQKNIKTQNGASLKLQLWDTAGTQRYRTISPIYYRNLDGVLLIFDLTDKTSFRSIDYWIDELNEKGEAAQIVLVGNKSDLGDEREVSYEQAREKANRLKIAYMQASSLDHQSTLSIFRKLIELIEQHNKKKALQSQQKHSALLQQNVKLSQLGRRQNSKQQDCC